MATPGNEFEESGINDVDDSSGHSSLYDNDDLNVDNVNPGSTPMGPGNTRTKATKEGSDINEYATPGYAEPAPHAIDINTPGQTTKCPPGAPGGESGNINFEENEQSKNLKLQNNIGQNIAELHREIYISEQERKENEILLDKQFENLIQQIMNKKFDLIKKLNDYYDDQKSNSLQRIDELNKELNALRNEKNNDDEKKQEDDKDDRDEHKEPDASNYKARLSVFTKKVSGKLNELGSWWNGADKKEKIAEEAKFEKHRKARIWTPTDEILKIVNNDFKLSTEWWNTLKLNHITYNIHDANLWRITEGGWYNAFGSIRVKTQQKKRWNIKILPQKNCDLLKPADIVLGIIESDKICSNTKTGGFWLKGFGEGFGYYGWNGKIFHKKQRGKVFGKSFYVNNVIGIELDMMPTPGYDDKAYSNSRPQSGSISNLSMGKGVGATLRYYINDKDIGIAFYDLDFKKEYSLAVSLNSTKYLLQLID